MKKKDFVVVRYGHRDVRDYRVTSHCALVSRAFGASKMIVCESRDEIAENTIKGVNENWGGNFKVEFIQDWREVVLKLKKSGYKIVHLTMYGMQVQEVEKKLIKLNKIAIIVGSQKVEKEVYELADYNVSVTNQPHSEIAALAVFLDRVQQGKELDKKFLKSKLKIIPQEKGKKVINTKK
ncbi:MAG: tRNA (cytidine(56)-2'-O)-methyltransferase [Candidatus Iainarchaeum sp.]|jgi:tRNA (cytidine56-2'-O)-methyltransferase|nr:MAG: tRNA (cytidine(56)-2'-O)-methyltransferase [archaeon ADurb.Bin336]